MIPVFRPAAEQRQRDFDRAQFSGKNTSFFWAQFSGENTSFETATFSGENTSFKEATFSGENTSFHRAQFTGKRVSFDWDSTVHGEAAAMPECIHPRQWPPKLLDERAEPTGS